MPVTGTFQTYQAVGNREDLTDLITNISPTDTPFYSGIGKTRAKATLHEWQTDELEAAGENAHVEGADTTFPTLSPTTRLPNHTQIFRKAVIVSGTQDVVDKAGRQRELAYQVAKKSKELARDLEWAHMRHTDSVAGDASTAREMNGVKGFITTNVKDNDGSPADPLAEDDVNEVLADIWQEGGNPGVIMCGKVNKQTISGFTTGVTKNLDAYDRRFVKAVDVYESDWGVLKVVPNRFMIPEDVVFLQMDLWKCAILRPVKLEPLAKTGDAEKRQLIGELTLESRQEKGSGAVINTNIG